MPRVVEWLGASAVYSDEELALMADLKAGVGAGEVGRRELELLHELKSGLGARIIERRARVRIKAASPFETGHANPAKND